MVCFVLTGGRCLPLCNMKVDSQEGRKGKEIDSEEGNVKGRESPIYGLFCFDRGEIFGFL